MKRCILDVWCHNDRNSLHELVIGVKWKDAFWMSDVILTGVQYSEITRKVSKNWYFVSLPVLTWGTKNNLSRVLDMGISLRWYCTTMEWKLLYYQLVNSLVLDCATDSTSKQQLYGIRSNKVVQKILLSLTISSR